MSLQSQKLWTWRRINGLLPNLRPLAWALVGYCAYKHDIWLTVTQGYRNDQTQDELHAKGRTEPGKPCLHDERRWPVGKCRIHPLGLTVTNAKAGESDHNIRKAFDVAVLDKSGTPTWPDDEVLWGRIGAVGKALGLSWGGTWGKRDLPHFYI